jgi:hypothetical protein
MRQVHALAAIALVSALVVGVARPALAADAPARLAVDVAQAPGVPAWHARALGELIAEDLADNRRVELVPIDADEIDLVWRAAVADDHLDYELHATWATPSLLARGRIAAAAVDRSTLAYRVRQSLDPALAAGGALDRRDHPAVGDRPAEIPEPQLPAAAALMLGVGLVVVLGWPFALGLALVRRDRPGRVFRLRSFRLAILIGAAGLVALALLVTASGTIAGASASVMIAGGLAWGWFGVAAFRMALPRFGGLERVEHGDVFRLVRAWSLVALQRLVRGAIFYAPAAALVWLIAAVLDIPATLAIAVVAPLVGLLARFSFLALVDNLALWLDGRLVSGQVTADDPWHRAAAGYVMGYVRRNGWPADEHLLDQILFLPGRDHEVILYGGGLTHARVIVGQKLLEMALAPYGRPHDYAEPRVSKLAWAEWNSGLVVPLPIGATIATPGERMPQTGTVPGETEHQPLGQPPTLAYLVEPDAFDKRGAYRPTEDPLWLDWDPGEEHDGTDPNDRDFLFGALVHELGRIRRHDDELATVATAAGLWVDRWPAGLKKLARGLRGLGHRLLSRYPAIVSDAFPALSYARHHMIQYLAWRHWGDEELLTARAYAPDLERQSTEILRRIDGEVDQVRGVAGATTRKRLLWLAQFVRAPVRTRRTVLARRLALAGAVAALALAGAVAVKNAIDYHPTYLERMKAQQRAIEDLQHVERD